MFVVDLHLQNVDLHLPHVDLYLSLSGSNLSRAINLHHSDSDPLAVSLSVCHFYDLLHLLLILSSTFISL